MKKIIEQHALISKKYQLVQTFQNKNEEMDTS